MKRPIYNPLKMGNDVEKIKYEKAVRRYEKWEAQKRREAESLAKEKK